MISIIIPLYNKEEQIASTLQSVFRQTYQDFEIVVVDDGSTDNSVAEVENFTDSRIRIIHQSNAGVSAARNKGIEEAKSELIAFLDADDEWKPQYLETQYALYKKYPECSVYTCNYEFKNAAGKVSPTIIRKLPFATEDGILTNYFEVASYSHPPIWTSSVMVQKRAIQAVGGFPVGVNSGEDLLTWARLAVKYQIAYTRRSFASFIRDDKLKTKDQQERFPSKEDLVGKYLSILCKDYPSVKGLKSYVALWHKMRAHIFLVKGYRKDALKECRSALEYHFNYKIIVFIILTVMPSSLNRIILKK